MKIYTIGAYGSTEEEFFGKLTKSQIDLFCDIRQRRGVRGRQYAFVNSSYLQKRLSELEIGYLYEKRFAPTREIREMQWAEDKEEHQTKKSRETLGYAFCCGYEQLILEKENLDELMVSFKSMNAQRVVLFCLESRPEACHRSLLAHRLSEKYHLEVVHL
jgi:uncharacterized protein (DUF488 family)